MRKRGGERERKTWRARRKKTLREYREAVTARVATLTAREQTAKEKWGLVGKEQILIPNGLYGAIHAIMVVIHNV